jgi:tetratricopeptide (TPR) repeat protein
MKANVIRIVSLLVILIAGMARGAQTPVFSEVKDQEAKAQNAFNQGVRAYRAVDFDSAAYFLKGALQLDPSLTMAELYLGATYASFHVPGRQTIRDREFVDGAIRSYESVLKKEPDNVNAILGLAGVFYSTGDLQKSREYFQRATKLIQHPVALYSVGAVDWFLVYRRQSLSPAEQERLVEEGLEYIDHALALNPDYTDAMAFENLLLLEKIKLTADFSNKYKLEQEAAEWQKKRLDTLSKNQHAGHVRSPEIRDGVTIFVSVALPVPPPHL